MCFAAIAVIRSSASNAYSSHDQPVAVVRRVGFDSSIKPPMHRRGGKMKERNGKFLEKSASRRY